MAEGEIIPIGLSLDTGQLLPGTQAATAALRDMDSATAQLQASLAASRATLAAQGASSQQLGQHASQATAQVREWAGGMTFAQSAAERLSTRLANASGDVEGYRRAIAQGEASLRSMGISFTDTGQVVDAAGRRIRGTTAQTFQSMGSELASARQQLAAFPAAIDPVHTSLGALGTIARGAQLAIGVFGVALSAQGLIEAARHSTELAIKFESLRMTINAVSGGVVEGQRSWQFLQDTSYRLGLNFVTLATQYRNVEAATRGTSLEGARAQLVFLQIAEAAKVMGLSQSEVQRTFLALDHMVQTNVVNMRELRMLQMALPGATEVMARALNVGTQELVQMIKAGQVLGDEVLVKLGRQFALELGGNVPSAVQTAQSAFTRFGFELEQGAARAAGTWMPLLRALADYGAQAMHPTTVAEQALDRRTAQALGDERGKVAEPAEVAQLRAIEKELAQLEKQREVLAGTHAPILRLNTDLYAKIQGMEAALLAAIQKRVDAQKALADYEAPAGKVEGHQEDLEIRRKRLEELAALQEKELKNQERMNALAPERLGGVTADEQKLAQLQERLKTQQKTLEESTKDAATRAGGAELAPDQQKALNAQRAAVLETQREVQAIQARQKLQEQGIKNQEHLLKIQRDIAAAVEAASDREEEIKALQHGATQLRNFGLDQTSTGAAATPFAEMFAAAGAKYQQDPRLLQAITRQESNFDANARSPKGALGLMQLMPSTATAMGVEDPLDPLQNIMGGARYLSQLMRQFGGNLEKALAAYNAGPSAVTQYGGVPPYPETQRYVPRVVQSYEEYKSMAGPGAPSTQQAQGALRLADAYGARADALKQEEAESHAEILTMQASIEAYGKERDALEKLQSKYRETKEARDEDTLAKIESSLATRGLLTDEAQELIANTRLGISLKELTKDVHARDEANEKAHAHAIQRLTGLEEQFNLSPDGRTITPEARQLTQTRAQLQPLMDRGSPDEQARAQAVMGELERKADPMYRFAKQMGDTVLNTFERMATGSKVSMGQLAQEWGKTILSMIVEASGVREQMTKLFADLFHGLMGNGGAGGGAGGAGAAGGLGGLLGHLFDGGAGAAAGSTFPMDVSALGNLPQASALSALAEGGPAYANTPYLVGEEGPELFVPSRSGTVFASGAMPANTDTAPVNVHFHFAPGTDASGFRATQDQLTMRAMQIAQHARRTA